ncbi:MAG: TlpA disulfide reductase family protein [Myxococcales bacterium]
MIRALLPSLLIFTSVAAMASQPRFLGPPVKKPPADAGTPDAGAAEPHGQADPPVLNPGDDAPMFSGVLHNPEAAGAQRVDLSSLVGSEAEADQAAKAVLISFFATWCKPCKKEMPFLQQLSTEYKDKGLRVLSVAIDKDEAKWPQIAELVKQNHVTYPIVKDRYNLIARQYLGDKTALPSVFIVDKEGKVAMVKQGYPNDAAEFLRAEVEKALQ